MEALSNKPVKTFWSRVDQSGGFDACWPWLGRKGNHGYGVVWDGTRRTVASRHSYALTNGPIPIGFMVLHRCDNPMCVNPDHLFLGTHADNMADMVAKGRQPPHMRPWKQCRRGHELTGRNLYVRPGDRKRCCWTCNVASGPESYRGRKRAAKV